MADDGRDTSVAFALGGLAGNNAHGAGFLQAALDAGVKPLMISCTSGQIRWTYEYLRDPDERGGDLRTLQATAIRTDGPTGNKNLDMVYRSIYGIPGVLKADLLGFWTNWLENIAASFGRCFRKPNDVIPFQEAMKTIPCRYLEPTPDPGLFEDMSRVFNECDDIGIAFNSFDPVEGIENVYLNDAARRLLTGGKRTVRYSPGVASTYRERTIFRFITPDAVRDALWLYNYGFDSEDRPKSSSMSLDGAYFRDIMLSELTPARKIYVVRPINYRWMGPLPTNYADLDDLKTKVSFNGAYDGERHQIFLINKLCQENAFAAFGSDRDAYHHVELEELEIEIPRGYLDYAFEDMAVFDDAYKRTSAMFGRLSYSGNNRNRVSALEAAG